MAVGRPSVYDKRIQPNLKSIAILKENGMSHDDIAKVMGIGRSTYYKHLSMIDEFVDATKNGDEELLKNGKLSLAKMIMGYTKRKVVKKYEYIAGVKTLTDETETLEDVGPEPSSVYFALVNKSNGEFRHKQEVETKFNEDDMREVKTFTDTFASMMKERKNEVSSK